MSPAGYSLAVLSSNRLRFADCVQWWGSFRLRSTAKTSQPSAGGRRCRRQNRQKCGHFIPALTDRPREGLDIAEEVLADVVLVTHELLHVKGRRVVEALASFAEEERLRREALLLFGRKLHEDHGFGRGRSRGGGGR